MRTDEAFLGVVTAYAPPAVLRVTDLFIVSVPAEGSKSSHVRAKASPLQRQDISVMTSKVLFPSF